MEARLGDGTGSTGYMICGAQCKMKMLSLSFKENSGFQDGDHRTLNHVGGPSEPEVPCSYTGQSPMKLALTTET